LASSGPLDILLVEDNKYDEKLTLRALRRHNLANNIQVVRDGAAAIDVIFGSTRSPKVILLDIKLPKIDGLEVLCRIRADPRTAHQPVVMLTSSSEKNDIDAAYALGANSYIVKPVDFQGFADAIRDLGLYWLLLNQAPDPVGAEPEADD
jgi:two-component system, response regulator